jgi:hypothetical protein
MALAAVQEEKSDPHMCTANKRYILSFLESACMLPPHNLPGDKRPHPHRQGQNRSHQSVSVQDKHMPLMHSAFRWVIMAKAGVMAVISVHSICGYVGAYSC